MDKLSPDKRSDNMRQIRSKNTKPEICVRSFLHKNGLRYRLHYKNLPGKPDLVFPKYKIVVFVHGCFWHGHSKLACNRSHIPKSNKDYWLNKIIHNQARDKANICSLEQLGWKVYVIWECEVSLENNLINLLNYIRSA